MSKRMIFDPWMNQYVIVDSEKIEMITNAIDNIYKEMGQTTVSSTEVYLIERLEKIKTLKKQYVDMRNERKLINDLSSDKYRVACNREFLARDLLLSAIDDTVI